MCTELPRAPEHLNIVAITAPGQQTRIVRVRRNKVLTALQWLKEFNPHYQDVNINVQNLDRYVNSGEVQDLPIIPIGPNPVLDPDSGPQALPDEDAPSLYHTMVLGNLGPGQRESDIIRQTLRNQTNAEAAGVPPAPGNSQNPLNWPEEGQPVRDSIPHFFGMAFPTLFPRGKADLNMDRTTSVTPTDWILHLLRFKDQRFAEHHRFLFVVFNYIQKRKMFAASNLYANQTLAGMSKDEFIRLLNASDQEANDLIRQITRQGANIWGSKPYMRKFGNAASNFISFIRHHSEDKECFSYFLTLSSADTHCNSFFRLFPDGVQHLSKILVKNAEEIPQGADRSLYCTNQEDYIFRRDFIIRHQRYYDVYFRHKVETYVTDIFCQEFGALDWIIRYEFQSRSAIHAHILLVLPVGVSREDRLNAMRPWHQEEELDRMEQLLDAPPPAADDTSDEAVTHRHQLKSNAAKAVLSRRKLVHISRLQWGLTMSHPSNDFSDRLVCHGGTLMQNPTNEVLRMTLEERMTDPECNLINMVNKTHIHMCKTSYCLKPRHTRPMPTIPEEGVLQEAQPAVHCRFGFPAALWDYEYTETGVQRQEPYQLGKLTRVMDESSVFRGQMRMHLPRNHPNTVIRNDDIALSWGANTCSMGVILEEDAKEYVCKYMAKEETNSTALEDLEADIIRHMADDNVNTICQKILLKQHKSRDYGHPEVCLYLNKGESMKFSRDLVHVGVLEDNCLINLESNDTDTIVSKSLVDVYFNRENDDNFKAFKELYARCPRRFKPTPKKPEDISLYEFASMFDVKWQPLLRYKVVCPHPYFDACPNENSNPEWYRKFCLTIIRLHDPRAGSLEDLQLLTNGELFEVVERLEDDGTLPDWVVDLIHKDRIPPRSNYIPTAEEDLVHDQVDEDDPLAGLVNRLEQDEPQDHNEEDLADFVLENADAAYNKTEDRDNLCPHWTASTADQLRAAVHNEGPEDLENVENALPLDALNTQQREAVEYLLFHLQKTRSNPSHQSLFEIIGSAGTGKTTIVKCLKAELAKTLGPNDPAIGQLIRFAAPTGCAAKLLPTPNSTLHSLLHLPVTRGNAPLERLSETTLKTIQEDLKHMMLLVIDEKSFIGAKMLANISGRLQQIFCQEDIPFGGVSVLIMGDFKQLSPVKDTPLFAKQARRSHASVVAGLHLFKQFDRIIILTQLQRQRNDEQFKTLLGQYVRGCVDDTGYQILESRHLDNLPAHVQAQFQDMAILLCACKKDFARFNLDKILALGTPRVLITAVNNPESAATLDASDAGGLPRNLVLCRGMKVMLTANLCLSQGLTNGSMGTVVGIIYLTEEDPFPTVLVQFPDYKGQSCLPSMERVYPVGIITRTWTLRSKQQSRTMLPLLPGYALSIHKSQGQTLDKVMIDLGDTEFTSGLTYTALTRVRDLESLVMRKMPPKKRFDTIAKSQGFKDMKTEEARKLILEQTRKDLYQQELLPVDNFNMEIDD